MFKRLIVLALVLGMAWGIAAGGTLKINFQSNGAPIPEGYFPDYSEAFGDRGNGWSYGWNVDMQADARDRNNGSAPDQRYDTLTHLQKGADKTWEVELPNGTYEVFLVCGDPSHTDQTNNFDIEGTVVEDPDGEDNFDEYTVTVEVADGRLTIEPAEGASNSKLCFVDITSDVLTQFFVKAKSPDPADGAEGVPFPLMKWTPGATAVAHNVYFGTTPDLGPDDLVKERETTTMYWHAPGVEPGVKYYWRIDEVEPDGTVHEGDVWSFTSLSMLAWKANPGDGRENVLPDTFLDWEPGSGFVPLEHALYFSENRDAVVERTAEADKGVFEEPGYDPGTLKADTSYYWRVDQIEPDGTIREGNVWTFTTVAAGPGKILREWWFDISGEAVSALTGNSRYPNDPDGSEFVTEMQNPENWAEQYGVRFRGWLFIPETGDYTFSITAEDQGEVRLSPDEDPDNAVTIATSQDTTAESSEPQTLEAGKRYYIEALMKENTIADNLTVSWQGPGFAMQVISSEYVGPTPFVPVRAYSPSPADGAIDTMHDLILTWEAGEKAAQHDVYFGTDANAVAAGDPSVFEGQQTGTSFDAGVLEWDTTYYWRVDEINSAEAESPWMGHVWSFTTANFLVVDDFESYTDDMDAEEAVFQTWIDGFTDQTNGSTVGYFESADGTFNETDDVHTGSQAMPLDYNNVDSPWFSEAYREFAPAQDWTVNGVTDLTIWYKGAPISFLETADGITISAGGADIFGTADEFRYAYKRLSGNGAMVARVDSIVDTDPWAKVGVMIREGLEPGAKFAAVYATPGNGVRFQARPLFSGDAVSDSAVATDEQMALETPVWVKIERAGNEFSGFYSTDGTTWTPMAWNPQNITMTGNVYIGLAVTSHNTSETTVAEFSGVTATGATGQWQVAEIGIDHPGNSPDEMYVTVEDTAGNTAKYVNPDPAAVNVADWTAWKVPLSEFAGVGLARVEKLTIGVGDGTPDGAGLLLIDDIRVTKPEPVAEEPGETEAE